MVSGRLERVRVVLETVTDPEIPVVAVTELGILRDVQLDEDSSLMATIAPTYPGHPTMEQTADDMGHVLRTADVSVHRVCSVLSSTWTTDWVTTEGQRKLRDFGITPPAYVAEADGARLIRLMCPAQGERIIYPQCGSHDTMFTSVFGPTACKVLCRCRACRRSLDYFKPC